MKMNDPHRYIVVDDDSTNNMICEFVIKRFDSQAEIEVFNNPEEALVFIRESYGNYSEYGPTILFLDINMPTMTGWEVLDVFKEFALSIRDQFIIYILSSSIEDFSREKELYPFVTGFICKPLKVDKLEAIFEGRRHFPATVEKQSLENEASKI